ncbi:hypothetical protein PROFUN_14984 [Planoprotostelium fungivorum]|uniref:Uncharacterized protein n=1 Tax=Planoprotostelium fungivorum TaxID=1890364 RepID=A0A2P6MY17_9EUKA|nr:hypothetical protein PROFUN_14984 [Planoprotostelium fungivorum]
MLDSRNNRNKLQYADVGTTARAGYLCQIDVKRPAGQVSPAPSTDDLSSPENDEDVSPDDQDQDHIDTRTILTSSISSTWTKRAAYQKSETGAFRPPLFMFIKIPQ